MKKLLLPLLLASGLAQAADPLHIDVYRDPYCGCCTAWIDHLKDNGFSVADHIRDDMRSVKQELGVPGELASCHTGVINAQFVEGHVPATDIQRMLEQDNLLGIAVPGMPVGSPGMEIGNRVDAYDVIALDRKKRAKVFASYP